ncbi:hypothetical protein PoB_003971400 [Plakobranchus ocellatus]|uniref:Uncharacterized protein n=1 Tax=Plakobranchus ocellatus TaxID=259542 RepID=A0AAV4B3H4_9GAST|nr:hypothetical protein PoB_003971400 [Plakobranchus ocellatus]
MTVNDDNWPDLSLTRHCEGERADNPWVKLSQIISRFSLLDNFMWILPPQQPSHKDRAMSVDGCCVRALSVRSDRENHQSVSSGLVQFLVASRWPNCGHYWSRSYTTHLCFRDSVSKAWLA